MGYENNRGLVILRHKADSVVFGPEKDIQNNNIYRYELTRNWGPGNKQLCFIMFNPSTADNTTTDPTTKRCIAIAQNWHYDGIVLYNLYAFRSTKKEVVEEQLKTKNVDAIAKMIGPKNKEILHQAIKSNRFDRIICAWGEHRYCEDFLHRSLNILQRISSSKLRILNVTKQLQPNHPLSVSSSIDESVSDTLSIHYIEEIRQKAKINLSIQ